MTYSVCRDKIMLSGTAGSFLIEITADGEVTHDEMDDFQVYSYNADTGKYQTSLLCGRSSLLMQMMIPG